MAIERALCPVLVGRERELGLLEDALLATLRGEGRVVVLAGDAGMGKTRLATEVSRRAARIACAVMAGSCAEAKLAIPYLPFAEAIGNYLATSDLDQLRAQLGPAARELAQLFPQLGRVRVAADGGDPAAGKLRLFEAILSLLRIAAAERGLLLVIEDVHWIDASARELLDYLSRRLEHSRILVLVTYRREELHHQHPLLPTIQAWRRSGLATLVELEPLPANGIADMVRAIFDEPEVTDEFRDFMHGRTEGNPFVLEEMLKTALDRKDIFFRPETGLWDRKTVAELQLPPTVRDTILLRLERLTKVEAEMMRAAAVLGRSFDSSILVSLSGRKQAIVEAALEAATRQQLLEEDHQSAGRYRFRHALTQEAIYQDMSAPQRQRLHRAAAEALRKRAGATADLAYHLMAANRWQEAEPVCLQAAEDATRRRGYREAAMLYARMIPHLSDPVKQGRVRCLLGEAHYDSGTFGDALLALQEGTQVLERQNHAREAAHYLLTLGRCHWDQSRPDLARAEFERVLTILEPEGPSEDLAFAYVNLARLHYLDAENRETLDLVARGIDVAVAAGADAPRIWAYIYRGCALLALGHTAEGLADIDRSYQEAVERDLHWIASRALLNSIANRIICFRLEEAIDSIKLVRAFGGPDSMWVADHEILIHRYHGEPAIARRVAEETLPLARQAESSTLVVLIELGLAIADSSLGRFEEAHRLLAHQSSELEREEARYLHEATMRVHLDEGDIANAVRPAQSVLADVLQRPELSFADVELIDRAVEVFVQAGMAAEASQLLDRARTVPVQADNPHLARMEGRLDLATGVLDGARDRLQAAVDFFARVSDRDDEWRTRRALAEVKTRLGDRAGAEAELRAVLSAAEEHGHITEATAARQQLRELGVDIAPTAPAATVPEAASRQLEERFVTVMFVDVRGYTTIAAKAAPSDLADRVATFYRWTEQEIARHHGQVAQYGGDALMATFNVSGMRLDHCLHALQAGLAIRDKAAYNELPVGVGIAVGPAIVGQFSEASPVTTVGETSNLAARLQAVAKADEIVLSAEAFRRVRDWVHAQHLEARDTTLTLKGFEEAVAAFVLPSHALAHDTARSPA